MDSFYLFIFHPYMDSILTLWESWYPILIPNFTLCSLDLRYIWVQNLVTQINLTENQIFCEVEDLQRVPLESVGSNSP